MKPNIDYDKALERVVSEDAGSVLAVLIGQLRDFDLAEDVLQDAIAEAVVSWRRDDPPRNGAAWLLTVARRRAIDRFRRSSVASDESVVRELLAQLEDRDIEPEQDQPIPDERLRLIFTCCHPALGEDAQVSLTLRTLCGLSTPEIARAFLVAYETMSQRILRAKKKIRDAAIPYEVPGETDLDNRVEAVLDVIYLIFNEGYKATKGADLARVDLCDEAIRLARVLYQSLPAPETGGLLALMLLHDARRNSRTDESRAFVPISEQDRSQWNTDLIQEGTTLLRQCLLQQRPGPFQIQAAISAVHSEAPTYDATDWAQISALYAALAQVMPSPVVTLNQAVAVANDETAESGLALLEQVANELKDYQPLHAARAELLRRCGRNAEAASAYRQAIVLTDNTAERAFLEQQLAQVLI